MENANSGKPLGLIIALGAGIGAATDDMGLWVAVGMGLRAARNRGQ